MRNVRTLLIMILVLVYNYIAVSNNQVLNYNTDYVLCQDDYKLNVWSIEKQAKAILFSNKRFNRLSIVKQNFILDNLKSWIEMSVDYKISIASTIAQGCLESAFGTSTLYRKYNAMYGIKSYRKSDKKSELMFDRYEGRSSRYIAYNSVQESINDHRSLLYRRYTSMIGKNWKFSTEYLKQKGYATAEHYTSALNSIIENYSLDKIEELI